MTSAELPSNHWRSGAFFCRSRSVGLNAARTFACFNRGGDLMDAVRREQIRGLLADGYSRQEIADQLGLSRLYIGTIARDFVRLRIGKPKKLSAEQSALVFEAQVQIQAMHCLIDRTLEAAGVAPNSRSSVLTACWRARGRIDIPHKLLTPDACEHLAPRPGAARRANGARMAQ